MEDMLNRIFETIDAKAYKIYLSGGDNFRYKIDSEYKANRKDKVDPKWRQECKEWLISKWNATVTDGIEADDALGIEQCKHLNSETKTVICSIDKDLLMIPGNHYNFLHEKIISVTPHEGLLSFYRSALIGDRSDNIFGIRGIGKVGAAKHLDHLTTEDEMFQTVNDLYNDPLRLVKNLNLLWIMQQENETWGVRNEAKLSKTEGPSVAAVVSGSDSSEQSIIDNRRC
jgi:5'-3' exonuclease